jgi:hybrid cluster-associated redox disulfide protein
VRISHSQASILTEVDMEKITKDMIIGDILRIGGAGVVPILRNAGMNCVGCPSAQGETLAEAAAVHGNDADALVNEINDFLTQ